VLMCISRATVSAVSCLVVPAFICIDLLISRVLKINDDDDDESHFSYHYLRRRKEVMSLVRSVCLSVCLSDN